MRSYALVYWIFAALRNKTEPPLTPRGFIRLNHDPTCKLLHRSLAWDTPVYRQIPSWENFMKPLRLIALILMPMCGVALLHAQKTTKPASSTAQNSGFTVPVEYYKLPNGLRVILSPDHTAPTVTLAVYYRIGFRVEPRDRTGFAHLFEHMMFQGSQNLGKMEFIRLVEKNGGILNRSTRFDFPHYF